MTKSSKPKRKKELDCGCPANSHAEGCSNACGADYRSREGWNQTCGRDKGHTGSHREATPK
jgi:hypothetical protein